MKNLMMLLILSLLAINAQGQNEPTKLITETITQFAKAGDTYDVQTLDKLLDNNYRVVMNRLFGSADVNIMDKTTYLSNISSKTFGGDTRTIDFQSIEITGNTAFVKVKLKGNKMTVISSMLLVEDQSGSWKIVSDMPVIQ